MTIYYCFKIEDTENENLIMISDVLDIGGGILQSLTTGYWIQVDLHLNPRFSICCLC